MCKSSLQVCYKFPLLTTEYPFNDRKFKLLQKIATNTQEYDREEIINSIIKDNNITKITIAMSKLLIKILRFAFLSVSAGFFLNKILYIIYVSIGIPTKTSTPKIPNNTNPASIAACKIIIS